MACLISLAHHGFEFKTNIGHLKNNSNYYGRYLLRNLCGLNFLTGDTMIDVFKAPPTPDLLKVKLLITEATYIHCDKGKKDYESVIEKARKYGHIHLQELIDNQQLFEGVDNILLVHFSTKYSVEHVQERVDELANNHGCFHRKLHLGLQMKSQVT